MKNSKSTSNQMASLAAKVLGSKASSETAKKLAASALAQTKDKSETGKELEQLAGKVLASKRYNETTKALAASVLAQANNDR
jgi:hypothetical protein